MRIEEGALFILETLESHGFEAYVVGGCVRDSLLGKTPQDWDICTNALPDDVKRCTAPLPVIETGIQHGTVTVIYHHMSYEVTTYRTEGSYSDNRRPDYVKFVRELKEDLSRRDFTINAMAYHPKRGLADYFGGKEDLQNGIIRCVGNAEVRFDEDGLRIMRALRFASVYGFETESQTAQAILEKKEHLCRIAAERIQVELRKLLSGKGADNILTRYREVFEVIIPEIHAMAGFAQNNPHHVFDVWTHTVKSIVAVPPNEILRLTMLLHDIGKPLCYTEDESGTGHFYNHAEESARLARMILNRLRFEKETIRAVTELVQYHGLDIPANTRCVKRWMNRLGAEQFRRLTEVWRADILAQAPQFQSEKLEKIQQITVCMQTVLEQGQCFRRKDLAVNGRDLIEIGIPPGKQVGAVLDFLMESVLEERAENSREELLRLAREKMDE